MITLGRIYYQNAVNEDPKVGIIEYDKSTGISIVYNNIKYEKPSLWITTEFQNSGKLIKYFEIPKKTDTPRAMFYTPPPIPKKKRSFGEFV